MEERGRHGERWVKALLQTRVPIRLVNGPEDPVSGASIVKRFREFVPNPDVVVLDGIGHFPQLEDPVGVMEAYFAFSNQIVR